MPAKVQEAVTAAGWTVELHHEDKAEELADAPGFHLVHNRPVTGPRCLVLRRVAVDPFWRIEDSNDRWHWQVAQMPFVPNPQDESLARGFMNRWREKLFPDVQISRRPFTFVPLQGKLTQRRHFQSMSPLQMIETVAKNDPRRPVIASLHPRESYSDEELAALDALSRRHPQVQLSQLGSTELLASCDRVVAQNSTTALLGYFLAKPAILFAEIDFHHIAASVQRDGIKAAFRRQPTPPFADYLFWYFKRNSIVFWADDAVTAIQARLRDHLWPI